MPKSSCALVSAWTCTLALVSSCAGDIEDPLAAGPHPGGQYPQVGVDPSQPGAVPPTAAGAAGGASPAQPQPNWRCADQAAITPGRAPLRRLTRFEYNNSVRDLLGDTTSPAKAFPSEEIGNGFGNDADAQSVPSLLAEQHSAVAESVAQRATEPAALAKLDPCTAGLQPAGEAACARKIVEKLTTRAYRRTLVAGEADALLGLYTAARAKAPFAVALATSIEALLQTPDFLYRIELGAPDSKRPELARPSGAEMATRLAYLFWGSLPDAALMAAADAGELNTDAGVLAQARRLRDDPRGRATLRFFFDNLLPIASLAQLERDSMAYPTYSAAVGAAMREETQRFLEYEIFEGSGSWPGALTAPYTFVNEVLAKFYGLPNVSGADFRKVDVNPTQRLGLLTQAGVMAGTTPSNHTNPVLRGSFIVQKLMCRPLALPSDPNILAKVKPPDPYSGKTARERYSAHSKDPVCATCHQFMDPIGLTFENYDAVGAYRTQENGETIDASGWLPGSMDKVMNSVELARKIAASDETQDCFAWQWLNYAYGRTLEDTQPADVCIKESLQRAFRASGYDVKQLLLDLTQTDAFLYLPRTEGP
jgi:Protein of unknown function (DUF1592)/Protein of unknown function (DUF1588)/Protein of unknown function (DUF1587)/Protein of unknown function (DUF1595)/Protein of unknown function (DUF1585)